MLEEKILQDCVAHLRKLPPIKKIEMRATPGVTRPRGGLGLEPDAILTVKTDTGSVRFVVYVKGVLRQPLPDHLSIVGQYARRRGGAPVLLLTTYAGPTIADVLKQRHINFVDSRGNAFINVPGRIYIDIQSRQRPEPGHKPSLALFRPKALQLLFVLLTEQAARDQAIRALAARAGVSFGRTASAMKELRDRDFVRQGGRGRLEFVDKKTLLDRWLINYGEQLRPKLVLGQYRMAPSVEERVPETLRNLRGWPKASGQAYALTGSLGAYLLTGYYRGPTTEIFVRPESAAKVREALNLIPARDTNTTMLGLFSPAVVFPTDLTPHPVAHPLLIYAELLHQGGSRNTDAAKVIYDTFLKRQFDGHRS